MMVETWAEMALRSRTSSWLNSRGPGGLHHQHADGCLLRVDGNAEEGVVPFFAGLGKVQEAGMRRGVHDHHGVACLHHQSGQSLVDGHGHPPHGRLVEAPRGAECQPPALGIEQVDRADLGLHALRDDARDAVEAPLQVLGFIDEAADLLQGDEM